MRTPGAAISTTDPKLLKSAKVSSFPAVVEEERPPHLPSVSTIADTAITSG